MKTKSIKKDGLVEVPQSTLMALVMSQIRGVVLFPEKIEAAKKQLKRINRKMAV